MIEGYIRESDLAPATVKSYRRQFAVFQSHVGHDDARAISKADIAIWKDKLLAGGGSSGKRLTPKSVGDTYLAVVRAVFAWGVANDHVDANPAVGVTVKKSVKTRLRSTKGLDDSEALTILRATLTEPPPKLSPKRAFARRWVPWICAYTGARVNEITQLRAEDVTLRDGQWTIRITPEAGPVKDRNVRTVALHPHLVEQGFCVVVGMAEGPLFYDPTMRKGGSAAHHQSKKVGEYLARWVRSLGVDDPDVAPNHGWRHRFKTQARDLRLMADVVRFIQGHAPNGVEETYGDVSVSATFAEISRIPFYQASS